MTNTVVAGCVTGGSISAKGWPSYPSMYLPYFSSQVLHTYEFSANHVKFFYGKNLVIQYSS